jgi:PST family polysaccharide transporter
MAEAVRPVIGASWSVRWVSLSQGARTLVQLGGLFALSHLLPPRDFGILAIATVMTTFVSLLRDMGTASALIQKQSVTDELRDAVFWFNVIFGVLLGAIMLATAPAWSYLFHDPMVGRFIVAISVSVPLTSVASVHQAMLERIAHFKTLAQIEISSSLLSTILAVASATFGFGVFSFAVQAISLAAFSTGFLLLASRWKPSFRPTPSSLLGILRYSGNLVSFNVINYFARYSDNFLVGRYLGANELGFYSMAYRIMLFPLQSLTFVVTRTLFPYFSANQDDRAALGNYYLRSILYIVTLSAPMMVGVWELREPVIISLLGKDWIKCVPLIFWLAPTGLIQSMLSTTGTVFMAIGRTDLLRNVGIANTILAVASFCLGLKFGIVGVACAYFFANVLSFLLTFKVILAQLSITMARLLSVIWIPIALALVMGALIGQGAAMLSSMQFSTTSRLAILIPLGASVYLALMATVRLSTLKELAAILRPNFAKNGANAALATTKISE